MSLSVPFLQRAPTPFRDLTALALAATLMILIWAIPETRQIYGNPVWIKPFKFAISFAVFFATLALVASRLSDAVRKGTVLRITVIAMAAAFLGELGYITFQAAQAESSHYNFSTPFHFYMYRIFMAGGAQILMVGVAVVTWLVWRDREADFGPATRAGILWGFCLTFVLTEVTAFTLAAVGRHIGVHPEGAPEIWLLGWSGVTGDLRVGHFFALHAMQVLPLLGLALDRSGRMGGAIPWVALAYGAVTLAVYVQALMGLPLIRLG